jgi:lipopolysaccharide assembly outer membrane protein LptD (OstA)
VRWIGLRIALVALCLGLAPTFAFGQAEGPSDTLAINGDNAFNWIDGDTSIIQIEGHVTITTDEATFSADNAVIWLSPEPNAIIGEQMAEVALLGNAKVVHGDATRTAENLYVTEQIKGRITFYGERAAHDSSDTDIYKQALSLRPQMPGAPIPPPVIQNTWLIEPPSTQPTTGPASRPTTQPSPIYFEANGKSEQTIGTDGKVAFVMDGGVLITQNKMIKQYQNTPANDQNQADISDHIELRAQRAVIMTNLDNLRELSDSSTFKLAEDVVEGVYMEGDVQISQTPAQQGQGPKPESRLTCDRVYYEFATERAILTNAVIHTLDPKIQIPIIIRAGVVRQLSNGEYRAKDAEITTSSFAVPSYSVRSSTAYIRQVPTNDPRYGNQTQFVANNAVFSLFHVPLFYLPQASGSMTDRGSALRNIEIGSSKNNGFGVRTELGIFETLGILPPENIDAYAKVDYFTDRGPAFGLNVKYQGGFITEDTRQPWDFQGDFKSYMLPDDTGTDKLGKDRKSIPPEAPLRDPLRGEFQYEHQQFLPDDWQFQFRFGLVSDPTFLEYWEEGSYDSDLPHNFEAYLKKQTDTEAFTLLVEFQPNNFVTTSGQLQEVEPPINGVPNNLQDAKPYDVEHVPEIGYYRIGDSLADDQLTFFSANTVGIVHYKVGDASLLDYGFLNRNDKRGIVAVTPGLPNLGQTGFTNDHVLRGDFRQEIDYPVQIDKFKVSPYVLGRLTSYSQSVDGGALNRLYGGVGMRATTAFWRVDDTAQSDLFDIHRIRHVIEPELNLFAGASNKDFTDVFNFDEQHDQVFDISAAQLALRQQWQTKRGGPGNWRSVDFFTLNMELNLFANKPKDDLPPDDFRGLYFNEQPENSIPRDSFNTDALWRVSDTTAVLADLEQNLDKERLATASVGVAVQRDTRLQYFVGLRYIGDVDSTIASFLLNYQVSTKYSVLLQYAFNFSEHNTDEASITILRHFDRFYVSFEYFVDRIQDDSGFRVGIFPEGLGGNVSTSQLQNLFGGSGQ